MGMERGRMHVKALWSSGTGMTKLWRGEIRRGRWDRFIMHVKWSPNSRVGFVELWRNGELVVPRSYRPTMHRDKDGTARPNYFKQGLYRTGGIRTRQVLYHDRTKIGQRLEDVTSPARARALRAQRRGG